MKQEKLRKLFDELHFTASLSSATLDQLATASVVQNFPAGTVVFREGTENKLLYVVVHGSVALDMNVLGRGDVRILSLGSGDVLAWSALLGNSRMTATATTLAETQVVATPADKLRELCEVDHEFGYHLMRGMATALSQRLLATRLQLLDLFRETELAAQTDWINP